MLSDSTRQLIRGRLGDEVGGTAKQAPFTVALAYPSPYFVGMSSLGFQQVYRSIQAMDGVACDRAFLPDDAEKNPEEPVSYESLRRLPEYPLIAFSVAYELEIAGLIRMLSFAGIPPLREERTEEHPLIVAGGPLTFSNPVTIFPYVDVVVVGEAEGIVEHVLSVVAGAPSRAAALESLADHPHIAVPSLHGTAVPPIAKCDDEILPAHSVIRTPHTELSNMFLIETERGCSRGCQYCVMRRTTNGGMRVVPKEVILGKIPEDATKVGLVGAAVSDHPRIVDIVNALADRDISVGLSSLRPDRLKEEFVFALRRAGYKTLTTALDGASQRLREHIERRGREPHYEQAAERARAAKMKRMKLYLMVGLPTETDADIDECVEFVSGLSKKIPIALGVAPFCAKRHTPFDRQPFAGVDVVTARLDRLRRGLKGRADVRATSAKWAWVEYVLSQGGLKEGRAVYDAVRAGGSFADYRRAFEPLGYTTKGQQASLVALEKRSLPLV